MQASDSFKRQTTRSAAHMAERSCLYVHQSHQRNGMTCSRVSARGEARRSGVIAVRCMRREAAVESQLAVRLTWATMALKSAE